MEKRFKPLKKITAEESEKYISGDEDFLNSFLCYYTLEPLDDGSDKVTYFTDRTRRNVRTEGSGSQVIYVMSNPSMPGLLKIGFTSKEADIRAKELYKATGVPQPFKLEFIYKCDNGITLEKEIHSYLKQYRTNNDREFFEMELKKAIDSIRFVGKNHL
jgi:hypothetical protein